MAEVGGRGGLSSWDRRLADVASQLTMENLLELISICQLPERRRERILRNVNPAAALFEELDRNDELPSGDEEALNEYLARIRRDDLAVATPEGRRAATASARKATASARTTTTATPTVVFAPSTPQVEEAFTPNSFPNPGTYTPAFTEATEGMPSFFGATQRTSIKAASIADDDDPELTFAIDFIRDNIGDEEDWTAICRELDFTGNDFDRVKRNGTEEPFRYFLNVWRNRTPSANPQRRESPRSLRAPLSPRVESLMNALIECSKKDTARKLRETIVRRRNAADNSNHTLPKRP